MIETMQVWRDAGFYGAFCHVRHSPPLPSGLSDDVHVEIHDRAKLCLSVLTYDWH